AVLARRGLSGRDHWAGWLLSHLVSASRDARRRQRHDASLPVLGPARLRGAQPAAGVRKGSLPGRANLPHELARSIRCQRLPRTALAWQGATIVRVCQVATEALFWG